MGKIFYSLLLLSVYWLAPSYQQSVRHGFPPDYLHVQQTNDEKSLVRPKIINFNEDHNELHELHELVRIKRRSKSRSNSYVDLKAAAAATTTTSATTSIPLSKNGGNLLKSDDPTTTSYSNMSASNIEAQVIVFLL